MARVEIPIVVLNPISPYNPVSGASVAITNRQTGLSATVYVDEILSTTRLQPLTTDAQGRVQGWLDRGAYRMQITIPGRPAYVEYHDSPPARDGAVDSAWLGTGSVTAPALANNAVTAAALQSGAVTSSKLGTSSVSTGALQNAAVTGAKIANNTVTGANLAPGAVTATSLAANVVPLGTVIDWWRPNTATVVPGGWRICDGASWSTISNDMGLSTGVIPNLIGKVTMGARLTTASGGTVPADGLDSGNGDAYVNAPGIGGEGGSNAAKTLTHTHAYVTPNHNHGINAEAPGTTSNGGHSHVYELSLGESGANNAWLLSNNNAGLGAYRHYAYCADMGHQTFGGFQFADFRPLLNDTDTTGTHSHNVNSHSHGGATGSTSFSAATNAPSWTTDPGTDFRLAHVGLLKIMKVKNV